MQACRKLTILRITATLYYGPGQGKPRSAEESLDLLRTAAVSFENPRQISMRRELSVSLHDSSQP